MPTHPRAELTASAKRHEKLQAWAACHELTLTVYRLTAKWPLVERYGLTAQARRAAYSAGANIAEGAAKRGSREFRRHLDMALGSLAELAYALELARDLDYTARAEWGEVEALRDRAGRLTWGLYRAVSRRAARLHAANCITCPPHHPPHSPPVIHDLVTHPVRG